jgi:hypothetical protein
MHITWTKVASWRVMHIYNHPFRPCQIISYCSPSKSLNAPHARTLTEHHLIRIEHMQYHYKMQTPPSVKLHRRMTKQLIMSGVAGCLSTLWHPSFCLIQHKASSYKVKTSLLCNWSLMLSACHQSPRRCHGGLPTSLVLILISTPPLRMVQCPTPSTPDRWVRQPYDPHWVSIHTNRPSINLDTFQ